MKLKNSENTGLLPSLLACVRCHSSRASCRSKIVSSTMSFVTISKVVVCHQSIIFAEWWSISQESFCCERGGGRGGGELRQAMLTNFTSAKSQADVAVLGRGIEQLQLVQDRQKDQELLDWLCPLNFSAQQSEFFSRRQESSGQWLLTHDNFKGWLAAPKETLFCPGPPGAGKTILASIVVDHLWNTIRNDDIGVAYAYCDYRKYEEQTSNNLVASLLNQLLRQQSKPISDDVNKLYLQHDRQGTRPSQVELFSLLRAETANFSRIFIVIDALDECSNDDRTRRSLLERIRTLQKSTSVNVMVTSRPLPDITEEFERAMTLEIRASEPDIRTYLKEQMSRLPRCVLKDSRLQARIVDEISGAVDGM